MGILEHGDILAIARHVAEHIFGKEARDPEAFARRLDNHMHGLQHALLERIIAMQVDLNKLTAAVSRLTDRDTQLIAAFQSLRDSSKTIANNLDAVKQQLADLQAQGTDVTAIQAAVDQATTDLNANSDRIEQTIADNPNTTNLPAAPTGGG